MVVSHKEKCSSLTQCRDTNINLSKERNCWQGEAPSCEQVAGEKPPSLPQGYIYMSIVHLITICFVKVGKLGRSYFPQKTIIFISFCTTKHTKFKGFEMKDVIKNVKITKFCSIEYNISVVAHLRAQIRSSSF